MEQKQQGFGLIGIIFVGVTIAIIGGTIGYVLNQQPKKVSQQTISPATTQSNEDYLTISEWDVQLKLSEPIKHLGYFKPLNSTIDGFSFTTTELSQKESRCSGRDSFITMPIGLLSRAPSQQMGMGKVVAHLNGYYYQFRNSDAACSVGDPALEKQVTTALNEAVLTIKTVD